MIRHLKISMTVSYTHLDVYKRQVLYHLEVGDGDAAGVAQEVGDDVDPLLGQHLVGFGRRRAVGQLGDDARSESSWFIWSSNSDRRLIRGSRVRRPRLRCV